jgi:hypothetical protein
MRRPPACPPAVGAGIALLLAAGLSTPPRAAHAADFNWAAGGQAQLVALAAMSLPEPAFGVAELQANGSLWSVGVAIGAAYERFPDGAGRMLDGGVFHGAFQWRPFVFLPGEFYRWVDPHIDLGFVLGGARNDDASYFRGGGYCGASLDVAVSPTDVEHVVLTVQYRWSPDALQTPDSAPDHLLLFGIALRNALE